MKRDLEIVCYLGMSSRSIMISFPFTKRCPFFLKENLYGYINIYIFAELYWEIEPFHLQFDLHLFLHAATVIG